jgi:predicted kinase
MGAIRIRSDVERKRLFSVTPNQGAEADVGKGIYSKDATLQTYQHLAELAKTILQSGYTTIVDATFATEEQRRIFSAIAQQHTVPFIILEFYASEEALKRRITARKGDVSDATLPVLEHQLKVWQPLSTEEKKHALVIDTEADFDVMQVIHDIRQLCTQDLS